MKKIIALMLAALMVWVALAGCSDKNDNRRNASSTVDDVQGIHAAAVQRVLLLPLKLLRK